MTIFMIHMYFREPAKLKESRTVYHPNGRVYTKVRVIHLKNGGYAEETKIYRSNGKLATLSQKNVYEDETIIRYTDWSDLGNRRLDFAARNGVSLYFRYFSAYFKEQSSNCEMEYDKRRKDTTVSR